MSNNSGILHKIIEKMKDPFLLAMVALVIVLAGTTRFPLGLEQLIVLSVVVVALFLSYLPFHYRARTSLNEEVVRTLTGRIISAIKDEGYVPGNERQKDLGASLIQYVVGSGKTERDKVGNIMASEFKLAFKVPDSFLEQ